MRLVPLTADYEFSDFDFGDSDLNDFLFDDAKPSQRLRIANTFILEAEDGRIAAYFCLLFAVSQEFHGKKIGSEMMDMLINKLQSVPSQSAFHYLTVDAYLSAVPFYEKNGFVRLTKKDEDEYTRLMFYDMLEVG